MNKLQKTVFILIFLTGIIFTMTSCIFKKRPDLAPSAVTNIYPAQSELVDENYFYSKWTKGRDPEGFDVKYRLNYARTVDGLDDSKFYETVETYFLLPNLAEGIWYWRVTVIDKAGNSTKSPIWSFTINGENLPQPVNTEEIPADPALIVCQVKNNSFSLDWPAYEDRQNPGTIMDYVIYLYDRENETVSRDMMKAGDWMSRTIPATTAHTTDTTHTFRNLISNTLYDWIIIAQKNASQTSVVGNSRVRTGNREPSTFQLLDPTAGATGLTTDITLSWTASVDPDGDTVRYFVYLDTISNTNRIISSVEGIEETTYIPDSLEEGRTYYWFVMAKDTNGAATRTDTQTFSTAAEGMSAPSTPTPQNGAEGLDATAPPLLQWEHDKRGKQIDYTVYMSSNPKNMTQMANGINSKEYQIPGLLNGETRYYWQIEARDIEIGKTTLSEAWTFKTGTIISPLQESALTDITGTQIELAYNKPMRDPTGKNDSYTVNREIQQTITARGITRTTIIKQEIPTGKIELKAGTTDTYLLTLEQPIAYGDTITIDYKRGSIEATDGGKLMDYSDVPVTNRVTGEIPHVVAATATTNNIYVSFNKEMQEPPAGANTQFSVQAGSVLKQIESVERSASDTYTIKLMTGQEIAFGEIVLLSYTKGSVQAENAAFLQSFIAIGVINTVPPPVPSFVSGETSEDGLTLKVTFDKNMADPTGKQDQFNVNINNLVVTARDCSITSATLNTDNAKIIELALSSALENGNQITLDYSAGDVQSSDGGPLETFTSKPITNRVPPLIPTCTAATLTEHGWYVELGFSREMNAPTALEANQFGVLVNGHVNEITEATLSSDKRVITLALQNPIGKNNEVHVSYTKGTVSATNEALLESFQNKKVNTDEMFFIWVVKGVGWNYSRIQDAIDAETTVDGDTIIVAAGTYRENVDFKGKGLFLSSAVVLQGKGGTIENTIIDGGNNGSPAVIIGAETYNSERKRISGERQTLPDLKDSQKRYFQALIGGLTIMNGAGTSKNPQASVMPAGINVMGYCIIIQNTITNNGSETADLYGYGIYVSATYAEIYGNEIKNNYSGMNGAGIYLANSKIPEEFSEKRGYGSAAFIMENEIKDNKGLAGAGIYIEENIRVIEYDYNYWKEFNSPNAEILFVENTSTETVNSYSGNTLIQAFGTDARQQSSTEGVDIAWAVRNTTTGTLTLRPATATEQQMITMNVDYQIGTEFHGGSLTIDVPSGFEITAGASVIINEVATPVSNYTQQRVTIKDINLETGTITLALTPQETPEGTIVSISSRNINYIFKAIADADGADSVWLASDEATKTFESEELSINTDIISVEGYEEYVQLLTSPKRLKVASETTVDTLLKSIKAADDSSQTYSVKNASGSLSKTDPLTETATLVVTAAHGNTQEYTININSTPFIKLVYTAVANASRNGSTPSIAWHDTIAEAVSNAHEYTQSTITVWPGYYVENLNLELKPIHLMSSNAASKTIRDTTIIDGNANGLVIMIGEYPELITSRPPPTEQTILEGFTIKNGGIIPPPPTGVRDIPWIGCGLYIVGADPIIRNNLITGNGDGINNTGRGIKIVEASPTIYDNEITKNHSIYFGGAGIGIQSGNPEIYSNTISENETLEYGGGIKLATHIENSSQREAAPEINAKIYANTFSKNKATKGAGIYAEQYVKILNSSSTEWLHYNSPAFTVPKIENTGTNNNTYTSNELLFPGSSSRVTDNTEGRDICFESEETPPGNITIALNRYLEPAYDHWTISYELGCEYASGTLAITFDNFASFTADSSITIGVSLPVPVSDFDWSESSATLTNISEVSGTFIKIDVRDIPALSSVRTEPLKKIIAVGDGDGAGEARTPKTIEYNVNTNFEENVPQTPNPADTSTDIAVDTALSWTNSNLIDTFYYDVYMGKSPTSLALLSEWQLTTTYQPTANLDPGTQYFWKIVSKTERVSVHSKIWTFTTAP